MEIILPTWVSSQSCFICTEFLNVFRSTTRDGIRQPQYATNIIAPFVVTSNGWFGAWGGLIATVKWSIGLKNSLYNDKPEGLKQLINIAICSVILLFASIPPIINKWENYTGAGFAIAGAAITLICCAYMITMYSDVARNVMKITSVILFVLWACIAGVTTFHGPFLITSTYFFYPFPF